MDLYTGANPISMCPRQLVRHPTNLHVKSMIARGNLRQRRAAISLTTALATILCAADALDTAVWGQPNDHHDRSPSVMEYIDRLDRPERDAVQKPDEVMDALALKPGMVVADLGAGSGYFTRRFLKAVTETGKVYAVDIEPQALKHIKASLTHLSFPYTVEFIKADKDDSRLPANSSDVIFLCNTYHHLEDRQVYFRKLRSALKPDGRVAIIDYYHDARSGELGFPKRHLVPRKTVLLELSEADYQLVKEHDFLPRQYFLEFAPGQR